MNKRTLIDAILTHASLIMCIFFIVLISIDRVNPKMFFIASDEGKFMLRIFCLLSTINAVRLAVWLHMRRLDEYKRMKAEAKKREKEEQNEQ